MNAQLVPMREIDNSSKPCNSLVSCSFSCWLFRVERHFGNFTLPGLGGLVHRLSLSVEWGEWLAGISAPSSARSCETCWEIDKGVGRFH